jgi:hypothetical protein
MELLAVQSFPSFPVVFMVLLRHLNSRTASTLNEYNNPLFHIKQVHYFVINPGEGGRGDALWIKKNKKNVQINNDIPNINNNN